MEIFWRRPVRRENLTNQDVHDLAASNPAVGRAVVRLFDQFRALRASGGAASPASDEPVHAATEACRIIQENRNYFPNPSRPRRSASAPTSDQASDAFEHGFGTNLFNVFGLQWQRRAYRAPLSAASTGSAVNCLPPRCCRPKRRCSRCASNSDCWGPPPPSTGSSRAAPAGRRPGDRPQRARGLFRRRADHTLRGLPPPAAKPATTSADRARFKTSSNRYAPPRPPCNAAWPVGIPLHLVRTDIAGNISKRLAVGHSRHPAPTRAPPALECLRRLPASEWLNTKAAETPQEKRQSVIAKSITKAAPPQCAAPAPCRSGNGSPHHPRRRWSIPTA